MGFFLKKLVSALVMPLTACLLLALAGWVLWWRGRRRAGAATVAAAAVLLSLASLSPVADALLRVVETDAPAFPGDSVAFVLVLAGGHTSDPALPLSSQLSGATLHRLVEGVAIATAQPWSRLLLSGWGGVDPRSNAEVQRDLALALGFPEERILMDPRARDTRQEAELWGPVVRGYPFALVTSASHMDRALELFRAQGLDPIPAPTGHLAPEPRAFNLFAFFPDASSLLRTRIAWHEILGRIWARMTGP